MQNRVMWVLEEAGEETVGTLRATLEVRTEQDEAVFRSALGGLRRLGFTVETEDWVALTPKGYAALTR